MTQTASLRAEKLSDVLSPPRYPRIVRLSDAFRETQHPYLLKAFRPAPLHEKTVVLRLALLLSALAGAALLICGYVAFAT